MKGGFTEKNDGQPSCYASTAHHDGFVPYHETFCNQTSLPEFQFKDELTCLDLDGSLMNTESSDFSNSPFFQGSEFSELHQLGESLSSSSMRSLSNGSPEYPVRFPSVGMAPESLIGEPTSGKQIIELRVTVPADCEMIDLNLHVLECFRERPDLELLSLEGSVYVKPNSAVRWNLLTIRLKGGNENDEGPFKEALARAIKEALA